MIGPDEVSAFAAIALNSDAVVATAHVETLRAKGLGLECIYLELLAPAARHLGELWEADLCDFTQVTLGLWRLQQVMYDLSPAFQNGAWSWWPSSFAALAGRAGVSPRRPLRGSRKRCMPSGST